MSFISHDSHIRPGNKLLSSIQTLIGVSSEGSVQHIGGAAKILKCRGTRPPTNDMEEKILMCLRGPVVCQVIFTVQPSLFSYPKLSSGYTGVQSR